MTKNWQAKYFEKTAKESHVNIFRSLEIENYFKQLLKKKGFNLHSYRLNFSNSSLNIFLSVYKKTVSGKKNDLKNKKTELLSKLISKNILKTIRNFTKNKFHINLKILNLNSHNRQSKPKNSINLTRLRLPEIEQLSSILVNQQDSAKLLGTFIAEYLKTTKRHNFFFNSLSKSLDLMVKQKDSKIKGIKILIKGRLNNAARSRNQYIKIGSISLITTNRIVDYSESTAFTPNGTIGIKIWISHKKSLDPLITQKSNQKTAGIYLRNL